jgi:DNA-binding GntR family transcriptional regulator
MPSPIAFVPSLREQIADRVRADLLSGHIAEGESLTEQELSERFAVSRTPVREALQQLTYEGLLEGRRHAGVRVTRRPSDAIFEFAVTIRRNVETFALRSCFHDLGEADFQQWDEILERMLAGCASRDYRAIAEHDIAFHRSIVRRAYERELEAVWVPLLSRVRRHFLETYRINYPDPLTIHKEHAEMVKVFRAGNLKAAVQSLENHIC